MPILDLQRRLRELGRIRLGKKNERGQPTRLDTFRLTSSSSELLEAAAELYGGTVYDWKDAPQAGRMFQLVTEVDALQVAIPPGQSLSQWYEQWSGGGCVRRCDGIRETISDRPCICSAEGQEEGERDCKPTTRLNLMLPDLWDIGVWRLETHGWYAAVELGGIVPLLQAASEKNIALQAGLRIDHRTVKRPGEPTKQFPVPVIEVGHRLGDLLQASGMLGTVQGAPEGSHGEPRGAAALPEGGRHTGAAAPALPEGSGEAGEPSRPQQPPRTEQQRTEGPRREAPKQERKRPEPKPAQPAQGESKTMSRSQKIAMRLRGHGASDEHRRALREWLFEDQAPESGSDLTDQQASEMEGMLEALDEGVVVFRSEGDLAWVENTPEVEAEDSPAQDHGQEPVDTGAAVWTGESYKGAMKKANGVGPATLIRKAREVCEQEGVDPATITSIESLANAPGDIQRKVQEWLEERVG